MATLGLKEIGKFLWEGREKGLPCWLSQFSLPKGIFPFPSNLRIAKFVWKMQKKVWYYKKWVGHHASFPPRRSVKSFILKIHKNLHCATSEGSKILPSDLERFKPTRSFPKSESWFFIVGDPSTYKFEFSKAGKETSLYWIENLFM